MSIVLAPTEQKNGEDVACKDSLPFSFEMLARKNPDQACSVVERHLGCWQNTVDGVVWEAENESRVIAWDRSECEWSDPSRCATIRRAAARRGIRNTYEHPQSLCDLQPWNRVLSRDELLSWSVASCVQGCRCGIQSFDHPCGQVRYRWDVQSRVPAS